MDKEELLSLYLEKLRMLTLEKLNEENNYRNGSTQNIATIS